MIAEPQLRAEVNSNYKLLFLPNKTGTTFELQQNLRYHITKPCIVIKGTTNYSKQSFISHILNVGLTDVILANMAKHPQYSATELNAVCNNPYEFLLANTQIEKQPKNHHNIAIPQLKSIQEINAAVKLESDLLKMKKLAEQLGCHIGNPKLFLVKHIFCDLVANQVDEIFIPTTIKTEAKKQPIYNPIFPINYEPEFSPA